jgi:hypothetical protein
VSETGAKILVAEPAKNVYVIDCKGLESGVYALELVKGTKTELVSLVIGERK